MDASQESTTELKRCSKCGEKFPATTEYFPPRKSAHDGLRGTCRPCYNSRKAQARANNIEHYRAKGREWIANNPNKKSEMSRRDYQKNIEARRSTRAKWRAANKATKHQNYLDFKRRNPEIVKERRRRDHVKHPYRTVEQARRRRARLKGAHGEVSQADVNRQRDRQSGLCWWCGEPVGKHYHADHYIPLARGGDNTPENIVVACHMCNSSRSDKLPWEWEGRPLWSNFLTSTPDVDA